jgi:hypothetical protein
MSHDDINCLDRMAQVVGWVGAASLAAGVWVLFQGPEPGIYDPFRLEASVTVGPAGNGGVATAMWRFVRCST